jgi:dihydroneopterin aldolase
MPTQEIIVQGLRVSGNHGVTAEERARKQDFEVDILAECNSTAAQKTDNLSDTTDYAALCAAAESIVEGTSFALIEKLAAEIADAVLRTGGLRKVTVTVKKLSPPMRYKVEYTAARVVREIAE